MKKVKNLTIGGIQQKIFNLVLITIILIVSAYTAVTIYQTVTLNRLVNETVAQLSDTCDMEAFESINGQALVAVSESVEHGKTTIIVLLIIVLALGIIGALVLAKRIVKPLENMTRDISMLGGDRLTFKMKDEYRTGDEIEILAESFAAISQKTVRYMDEVREVTAEKERIGTELALAQRIQANMLPNIFPAFPERSEFDIYATMTPAKEVGGDFYDFFLVDEDHLALVIADVSGKSVPAALFMMVSKILIQNAAMSGKSPAEVLSTVNEQICKNNREEMFVTVWIGILDLRTGKLTAANAGHEYPILKQPNGNFELLKDKHSFVVGGMSGIPYKDYELQLEPGSKLFLYTDGIAEATDANFELFGSERMLKALQGAENGSPKDILEHLQNVVEMFVGEGPQFDDLTMLCLQFKQKFGA